MGFAVNNCKFDNKGSECISRKREKKSAIKKMSGIYRRNKYFRMTIMKEHLDCFKSDIDFVISKSNDNVELKIVETKGEEWGQ